MAETKTALEKSGLTRGKSALIGMLSVVLAGVLYMQYGGAANDEAATPIAESAGVRPLTSAATQATTGTATAGAKKEEGDVSSAAMVVDETKWEAPELSEVVGYDPFALPPSFPQPVTATIDPRLAEANVTDEDPNALADALAKLETELKNLQERGVHVIVKQRDEYVAMIGDRTVHVGDEINGFTVTAIGPDGVSVERKTVE